MALTKRDNALARLLRERRPVSIPGNSSQAMARAYWFTLVRDIADTLYARPGTAGLTRRETDWLLFTEQAGYFGQEDKSEPF